VDGEDRDGGVVQKIKQGGSRGAGWRWRRCSGHALGVLSPVEGDNREKRIGVWVKGYGPGRWGRMGRWGRRGNGLEGGYGLLEGLGF
jgi:hypothetical protein